MRNTDGGMVETITPISDENGAALCKIAVIWKKK
mgnify:FL=1